jgi:ATP-dependent RNA helicase RhlE
MTHQIAPTPPTRGRSKKNNHPKPRREQSEVKKGAPGGDQALKGVFKDLIPELQKALTHEGYHTPTPIQSEAIPHLLEERDMVGCAQTGTGKTAAFTLPILQILHKDGYDSEPGHPQVLILAPTRELAAQIGESIRTYGRHLDLRSCVIFGGVNEKPQIRTLRQGVDIVVATPGRLLDLVQQGHLHLSDVDIFVLDEADRMLDMGFIHDIKKIIKELPRERWSLFFSATMPSEVKSLAGSMLHDPVHVAIEPAKPTVEKIEQKMMFVEKGDKDKLLASLLEDHDLDRVIVFTQMKHMANKVCKALENVGISAAAIHGNKSQSARTKSLEKFKGGQVRVLVATDIAARGIDVDGITHVVNYDLPNEPETYVHRIGRTARAGAEGDSVSFCSPRERDYLCSIEKLLGEAVPVDMDHAYHSEQARNATGASARPEPKAQRGWQGGGGRSRGQHGGSGGGARGGRGGNTSRPRRAQGRRSSSSR